MNTNDESGYRGMELTNDEAILRASSRPPFRWISPEEIEASLITLGDMAYNVYTMGDLDDYIELNPEIQDLARDFGDMIIDKHDDNRVVMDIGVVIRHQDHEFKGVLIHKILMDLHDYFEEAEHQGEGDWDHEDLEKIKRDFGTYLSSL